MVELEAQSVIAFAHLARELQAHNAPVALIADASNAARDEQRHVALLAPFTSWSMAELGPNERDAVSTASIRTLKDIAIDNATEGCVRETYGALIAAFQAQNALKLDVRTAVATIATDELGHSAYSWRLHDWIMTQLADHEREEVRSAMRTAVAQLVDATLEQEVPAWATELGLPPAVATRVMVDALVQQLWTQAS
jgi:hypothetical protein